MKKTNNYVAQNAFKAGEHYEAAMTIILKGPIHTNRREIEKVAILLQSALHYAKEAELTEEYNKIEFLLKDYQKKLTEDNPSHSITFFR